MTTTLTSNPRLMQYIMVLSVCFFACTQYVFYILAAYLLQWMVMFLVELVGIRQCEVKVILYSLTCFILIYITCASTSVLAILFVLLPALGLMFLPQVLTSTGIKYWKSTINDFVYFIYVCFGYWDSKGICSTMFQVEQKVKIFNSTTSVPRASGNYIHVRSTIKFQSEDNAAKKENSVDLEESYYYFYHVISSTIGTRVLLLMIFKIFTPLALYIRYTCPFPICVYDEKLLSRYSIDMKIVQT